LLEDVAGKSTKNKTFENYATNGAAKKSVFIVHDSGYVQFDGMH